MRSIFALLSFLLFSFSLFAQIPPAHPPDGGGEYMAEITPCLSAEERASIENRLTLNVEKLRQEGLLPAINDRNLVAFSWPLQKSAALDFSSYYGINNYVDQNTGPGVLDYNCGSRTYDGHNGIDIDIWPFPWYLMANDYVEIIAAADGVIVDKQDGNADNHCSCSGNWNAVYVQHADGSIAWYGHMKKNSLTAKAIGQSVSQGEYLGSVGSAGCSTQPHLHFEVYKALPYQHSNLIEPFQGSCNSLNSQSWWAAQQSYREPTLNALLTHSAAPAMGCPLANEATNFSNTFTAGSVVYFGTYYHDQLINHVSVLTIRKPDNTIWQTWSHTSPNSYNTSWWYWYWTLPSNAPSGTWKFEVLYQGQISTHNFTVTSALPVETTRITAKIVQKTSVALTWETATERDNDFFVVERSQDGDSFSPVGQVKGNGTSHTAKSYSFLDEHPLTGRSYYRLQQVDFNGEKQYSPIVAIEMAVSTVGVFPNPTHGFVTLVGSLEDIEHISLIDCLGNRSLLLNTQSVQMPIDLSNYPTGMYLLELTRGEKVERLKILKN